LLREDHPSIDGLRGRRLEAVGAYPRTDTARQFAGYLETEFQKGAELVRLSGAKVD
jgi:hypothetical protein